MFGTLCISYLENSLICLSIKRLDLATAWLDVAQHAIDQAYSNWQEDYDRYALSYEGAFLGLADRLHNMFRNNKFAPTKSISLHQFLSSVTSDDSGACIDCHRLIFSLLAVLWDDRDTYKAAQAFNWKRHPECNAERKLAIKLSTLFNADETPEFWEFYRKVFLRWLPPYIHTDSDAMILKEELLHALASVWLLRRTNSTGQMAYYEVLAGR